MSSRHNRTSVNLMLREDTALAGLKAQLGANYTVLGMNPPADAVDAFLMRYVRSADLNTSKSIEALKQRREFEKALPGVAITSYVVSSLRSGAFSVIGEDAMHRPILHIRLGSFRTSSDSSDTDRLILVLLEYMQCLAMRHFSEAGLDGNGYAEKGVGGPPTGRSSRVPLAGGGAAAGGGGGGAGRGGGGVNTNSAVGGGGGGGGVSSMSTSPATAQCQEIVILLQDTDNNVGGGGGGAGGSSSSNGGSGGIFTNRGPQLISRIVSLATKYFPNLIGGILIVDIGWAAQQTLKTNQAVQRVLDVVKAEHLSRFIDPQILPEDLGGKKVKVMGRGGRQQSCVEAITPQDFSQIVLRHWFNVVSVVLAEGSQARPLWQPLPLYFNYLLGTAAANTLPGAAPYLFGVSVGGETPPRLGGSLMNSRSKRGGASSAGGSSVRGGGQFGGGEDDDGVCSVMTDDPTTVDGGDGGGAGEGGVGGGGLDEEGARGLQVELQVERARRLQLENELTKLTLGITLDDTTLTRLEVVLKAIHGDVNVLVSEVVQKCKAETSAGAGRSAPAGPSLQQLIEATNRAVLQAIQEKEEVPAMKFAQPTERRGKKSFCCVIS